MIHRSEGATALLGLPGFLAGAQIEADGELWLGVETNADMVGCSGRGTRAVGHGHRRVKVRDLPIAGRHQPSPPQLATRSIPSADGSQLRR